MNYVAQHRVENDTECWFIQTDEETPQVAAIAFSDFAAKLIVAAFNIMS